MRRRTALVNQIRGVLPERGDHRNAWGAGALARVLANALADGEPRLSPRLSALLVDMREEWQGLDERIQQLDRELNRTCGDSEPMRRLVLGISKRGNSYLRTLFVHGARALRRVLDRDRPGLGRWVGELEHHAHVNVVIVALANKLARKALIFTTSYLIPIPLIHLSFTKMEPATLG